MPFPLPQKNEIKLHTPRSKRIEGFFSWKSVSAVSYFGAGQSSDGCDKALDEDLWCCLVARQPFHELYSISSGPPPSVSNI